jgi:hypothetical protein
LAESPQIGAEKAITIAIRFVRVLEELESYRASKADCGSCLIVRSDAVLEWKINYSFLPRSRAFEHVLIMHKGQYNPDAEVDNAQQSQKSRQFAVFGDLK